MNKLRKALTVILISAICIDFAYMGLCFAGLLKLNSIFLYSLLSILIAAAIGTMILDHISNEKVDKGFALSYFSLSDRRKFIRTLWMIIPSVIVIGFMFFSNIPIALELKIVLTIIIIISLALQLIITYKAMKKNKD